MRNTNLSRISVYVCLTGVKGFSSCDSCHPPCSSIFATSHTLSKPLVAASGKIISHVKIMICFWHAAKSWTMLKPSGRGQLLRPKTKKTSVGRRAQDQKPPAGDWSCGLPHFSAKSFRHRLNFILGCDRQNLDKGHAFLATHCLVFQLIKHQLGKPCKWGIKFWLQTKI